MTKIPLEQRLAGLTDKQRLLLEARLKQQRTSSQPGPAPAPVIQPARQDVKMDFTLFFFSGDGTSQDAQKYRLVMEAARFADERGFKAIWTPERHFQTFGGLYPNPAILSTALAMVTKNLRLRSGSMVLPLHGPVRAAEDWSLVDNLSGGRVDVSFASGWHKHDFVISPHRYADRREFMFENIAIMRRLWAGETVPLPGPDGEQIPITTLPRPIQASLPFWIACNSPQTWTRCGEMGGNVLSGILTGVEDVGSYIKNYRLARRKKGHDPRKGIVSLMLHTYIGQDEAQIRALVEAPLRRYLKDFINQFRMFLKDEVDSFIKDEEALLSFAVDRYFTHTSLLGTPQKCGAMIERLATIGVNEIACLIDFGLGHEQVMQGLHELDQLRQSYT